MFEDVISIAVTGLVKLPLIRVSAEKRELLLLTVQRRVGVEIVPGLSQNHSVNTVKQL